MTLVSLLQNTLWAALASAGFAVLFNAPRRALIACAFVGSSGYLVRALLVSRGISLELSTLAAATIIGFLSYLMARSRKMPTPIFAICGAIPLVPGRLAFTALISLLQLTTNPVSDATIELLTTAVVSVIRTGLILAALAGGIIAPVLLFQRQKPVV